MSFLRTTEEGEIGEEEGEIIASPLTATATATAANIDRANAPPADHVVPSASHPAAPFAHRRNISPPFRRFPTRGRGGGGGRGPPPRQNSWTAANESRWGNKVTQGANEQHQQSPRFRPASSPGSSNEPIQKPGFTRVESTGSAGGSLSFSPNAPNNFSPGRNDSFRPNEPPRNEGFGGRPSGPSEAPWSEGFTGRPNDLTGGRNDSFGGRPNGPSRNEGFGGRPDEASSFRNASFGGRPSEPPAGRNEIFRPNEPNDGRNESFGGHSNEPPQDVRNQSFRPSELSRDTFSRIERARSEGLVERDALGRQPHQQADTARYSRPRPPLERQRSEPADTNAYNGLARPMERQRSEQTDTNAYNGPRPMERQRTEQIDTPFGPREQSDTAYGPRPPEHRVPAVGPSPHRAGHSADAAYEGPRPQDIRISATAHPLPPHRSDHGDTSYGPRPMDHLTSTSVPPSPPHRLEQADSAYGHRSMAHRTSTTPHRSGQGDSAYGHRPIEHRTSAAGPLSPHRSDPADSAFRHRPMEHRTSAAAAPPPPPLNIPLPPSLPPPPRRGSSYTASTFDRPEAPRRASASDFRPDRHKSFETSSPRFGTSPPQMKRKSFEGSSLRSAFGSSPQMAHKGLDSLRKGIESSPQNVRQTSTSSRFPDDSFRSVSMPPITSSELLSRAPRHDSGKVSSPSKKEEPVPAPAKPAAPKSAAPPTPPVEAPLTCLALGDPRIVARAEKVIQQLHELVPFPAHEESVLPTKQFILEALAGVDLKIKKGQSDVDRVKAELQQAVQAEQDEAERLENERLEEAQRKLKLEQKAKEEKRLTEHCKELQLQIDERQRIFEQEQQQAQVALEQYVQKCISEERMRLTLEIKGQLEVASKSFDQDIAKAQKALSKATMATTKAESRMANAVAKYKQSKEMEIALPELARERKKLSSAKTRELISSILAENKRCAEQAHLESDSLIPYTLDAGGVSNVKTNEEWANEARLVTGLADALYTEPSESPYFEQNNQTHALIEPLVTEQIRKNQRRLQDRWEDLVEEYVIRKAVYDKTHTILFREKHNKGTSISCILGANPSSISGGLGDITGGRSTANPYRRARRGNPSNSGDVVRSEYEQEQIIAELTAKEAMEKRIKHGGSKLPRQVCQLEKDLTATYIRTFQSRRVEDSMAEAEEQRTTNIWSDMEKCIFLDRFMQHPKDFKKIASFLRNKSTKDCIAFYYNSKQTVPYKMALREHIMRRKRRGEYHTWDATIQASLSVGAVVTAGMSEAKPLTFSLPESDKTFFTYNFHPLNHEILDQANINSFEVDIELTSPQREGRSRKRSSAPLFTLDTEQRKLLRTSSQEDMPSVKQKLAGGCQEGDEFDEDEGRTGEGKKTPVRRAPQKWTALEKKDFLETLETHGKNWSMLASAVGSKSISQIKNYYYDHKKQFSKHRGHVEKADDSEDGKARRGSAPSIDGDTDFAERVEEQQVSGGEGASLQEQGRGNKVTETDNVFEQQGRTTSGQSLTSAADIWAHAQILKQQQQISSQETRRLLHSHTHHQVMQNLTSIFPWVSAHVAQAQAQAHAQAAALQQQQQQQQQQQAQQQQQQQPQEGNSLGATHAAVRDWVDPATQMQNLLAMRQASHHGFSVDPTTHLRSMAMAGFAAMNQSLANNSMMQTDATSAAPSSFHPSETDRVVHGFGGSGGIIEGGFSMGHGGGAASAPSASSSAALAFGMLAHSMNLGDTKNGNGYPMDETKTNEQGDMNDRYQSG